jgi:lysophospholipase L1-like esterase
MSGTFQFGEEFRVSNPSDDCTSQSVKIGGPFSSITSTVCVYERLNWRYGFYIANNQSFLVVGIGSDKAMYKVTNPGYGHQHEVVHLPGTDDFMYNRLTAGFTNNHNLMIAHDFPSKLQRSQSGVETVYTLREGSYEPLIPDSSGNPITTGAVGVSENGQWVAVEAMGVGFLLVDTQTEQLSLFSNYRHTYGQGSDARITFVTSDDGKYVATFDYNIQPKIYTLPESCVVKSMSYEEIVTQAPTYQSCPDDGGRLLSVLNQQFGSSVARSKVATGFNYKNDILYFSREEWSQDLELTTYSLPLQADNYQPSEDLKYLALGDSYSSGEGDTLLNPATNQKYYRDYTDNEENASQQIPREKCHISTRSYPYLLAQGMGLTISNPTQWNSVACSGAQVWDVVGKGSGYYTGQNERLKSYDEASLKAVALNEFIPGRDKQVEFVKRYKPKAITLTMGGNDVGFADKINMCATPITTELTCRAALPEGRSALATQIRSQYDKLKSLYEELYSSSGSAAKIYILGYPKFINGSSGASCGLNIGALNQDERKMIDESVGYMNDVIEKAARAAGVKYVDIENSLESHRLCDGEEKYVTGITNIFGWNGNERQESFHPNAKGNHAMAMAVWSEQNMNSVSLLDYDICPSSDQNACPDVSATKESITIPSYFESSEPEGRTTYSKISPSDATKGTPMNITTGLYSLAPLSSARLTLHSDPVDLGSYEVNSEGNLKVAVRVPTTIPAGYHTLLLNGETYSGEEIEYEQIILVKGSDPNDIDEDNVGDDIDPCLFVTPVNIDDDGDGIDDACDIEIGEKVSPYRVRPGDPARTYNSAPENDQYFYIERRIAASSVTGITDDYDPDSDGWAIVGASRGRPYTATSVPDIGPVANFTIVGEATDTRPYVYIRAGGYGCVGYTPASLKKVKPNQVRTIKRVAVNTDKCRKEAPGDDVDKNGLPDNTQPLYQARNGDPDRGEDLSRIYLLRSFHAAEAQLGISDYSPTGTAAGRPDEPIQEWNLLASSKEGVYIPTFNRLVILEDSEGNPLPTVLTKKQNGQCIAYQPRNTKIIKQTTQDKRRLIKLANVPEGASCE